MALINCTECNAKISDNAKSCPNCGNPNLKQRGNNRYSLVLIGIGITLFMIFIMFRGNMSYDDSNDFIDTTAVVVDTSAVIYTPQLTTEGRKENIEKLRNMFLDTGIDVKVSVYGKNNEILELKYPLFDDVWFRKFDNLHNLGYQKIILNDNYEYKQLRIK